MDNSKKSISNIIFTYITQPKQKQPFFIFLKESIGGLQIQGQSTSKWQRFLK